jgi:hypothetical protein
MKYIKFSPVKKEHVGDFIVKVTVYIDSPWLELSMSYKVIVKVLDVLKPPPPPDTLGKRVRFYISKIT